MNAVLFAFGPMELVVIGVVVLLLFGSRVPSTMRSLGLGLKEFRDGMRGDDDAEKGVTQ
jgi:sec-independent protein translocase protein TatA